MSKLDKLLEKLKSNPPPKTFKWSDLVYILERSGCECINGKGSGRLFLHTETQLTFSIHEPHPENTIKAYVVKNTIEFLKDIEQNIELLNDRMEE